jgi:hypothetical protein
MNLKRKTMKHTNFRSQINEIKKLEQIELTKAVMAHGGKYEWSEDEERPIVAVNTDGPFPEPMDVEISKVIVNDGVLKIFGDDKNTGIDIDLRRATFFAGHLSSIIDYLPETDEVSDVSEKKELFEVVSISRDDFKEIGFDGSQISDDDMISLAEDLRELHCSAHFWNDVQFIAESFDLPLDCDSWFNDLEFKELEKVTGHKQDNFSPDDGYQDFIDACEKWWNSQSVQDKRAIYNYYCGNDGR